MRQIPILMYHSISSVATGDLARYTLTPALFREHLDALAHEGYAVWNIGEIYDAIRADRILPNRVVGMTFDDAFADFLTTALPALEDKAFGVTLYVPTAYLGSTSQWLTQHPDDLRVMLTADEVATLPARGVECGAHSHTHAELDRLPVTLLESEVAGSKGILEDVLGRPVRTFAYPFGYYNRRTRAAVKRAAYTNACAVGHEAAWSRADPFALPRFLVLAHTSAAEVISMLLRQASPALHRIERAKQTAWRGVRRVSRSDGGRAAAEAARTAESNYRRLPE